MDPVRNLAFLALSCFSAADASPRSAPPDARGEILATLDDYFAAVNARDPPRFLTFFSANDLTVIEDKDLRLSRQAFEAFVEGFFKDVIEIRATWEKREVFSLSPGIAVVVGTFKVAAKDAKGDPMTFRSAFTFLLVKQGNAWRLKHVHESSLDL